MSKCLCFGEILWDELPSGRKPGGAPMNVCYHLHTLGSDATMISRIGSGADGRGLIDFLSSKGLEVAGIQIDEELSTGVVKVTKDDQFEVVYQIGTPAAWDNISFKEIPDDLTNRIDYLVFGSLACRYEGNQDTLHKIGDQSHKNVFDINLREPHFTKGKISDFLIMSHIVKMNEHELEKLTVWFKLEGDRKQRIRQVHEIFQLDIVIVTLGANGATVFDGQDYFSHPGFEVDVADTVGSGDSFLAGFLHCMSTKKGIADSLEFASALGAFVATNKGAVPDYNKGVIENIQLSDFSKENTETI